jgi:hypothetical protein
MKNDEKQRKKQWKTMKNRETRMNNDETKTMKNDEKEKKKQWKMMKKRGKNNEQWWNSGKIRKHDEK